MASSQPRKWRRIMDVDVDSSDDDEGVSTFGRMGTSAVASAPPSSSRIMIDHQPQAVLSSATSRGSNTANLISSAANINLPSQSSGETTLVANGSVNLRPSSLGVITATDLHKMYKDQKHFSILLVDCRPSENFRERRIKYSFNVPPTNTVANSANLRSHLLSKTDVIKYFLESCPDVLGFLCAPGFYKDIVVYDDASTCDSVSNPLKIMIEAIAKWNFGTRTRTRILQGGFQEFAVKNPRKIVAKSVLPAPWTFSIQLNKRQQYQSPTNSSTSTDAQRTINGLNVYLENVELADNKTTQVVELKKKLKSLEALKRILLEEQRNEMNRKLDATLPATVKCRQCRIIFSGNIFQCARGHCICGPCACRRLLCPICFVSLDKGCSRKIRNAALEELMKSSLLNVMCPYSVNGCKKNVAIGRLSAHLEICDKKKGKELVKIEELMISTVNEIQGLNQQLKYHELKIVEHELDFNLPRERATGIVPENLMEKLLEKKLSLVNAKMALALETFMCKAVTD